MQKTVMRLLFCYDLHIENEILKHYNEKPDTMCEEESYSAELAEVELSVSLS